MTDVKFKPAWGKKLIRLMQNGWTLDNALKACNIGKDKYNYQVQVDQEFKNGVEQAIDSRYAAGPTRRFG